MKAPASVSFIQPLISRGDEIRAVDDVVAYYCYYSAVRQVLEGKLHLEDPEVAEFATSLLTEIENMKNYSKNQEILEDDDASRAHVLNFAANVFTKAERMTHNRKVSKATGAGFAAAAVFLGLESVWGELDPETVEKVKYSKFQAMRILRAIKNGEDPNDLFAEQESNAEGQGVAGEEGQDEGQKEGQDEAQDEAQEKAQEKGQGEGKEDKDIEQEEQQTQQEKNVNEEGPEVDLPEPPRAAPENDLALPHAPKEDLSHDLSLPPAPEDKPEGNISPPPPPPKKPENEDASGRSVSPPRAAAFKVPSKAAVKPAPKPATQPAAAPATAGSQSKSLSPAEIISLTHATGSAQKHAKYAVSALNYDDIDTAMSELEQALQLLKTYQSHQ